MWNSKQTLLRGTFLAAVTVLPWIAQAGTVSVESQVHGQDATPRAARSASSSSPQAVEVVLPVYPLAARRARMQGVVQLAGVIDASGRVQGLECVTCGEDRPGFSAAAMKAISAWTYERPVSPDGAPVMVSVLFQVRFTP
jgi:TonB family protein